MDKQALIFTDMDGTLLDHYDYSFNDAIPVMEALVEKRIPIIANTSKTFAEMEAFQKVIGFNAPFICENGAAVYIPKGYFKQQPKDTEVCGYYWVKSFCPPREHWLKALKTQGTAFKSQYIGFSAMSVDTLCSVTDLTPQKAQLALMRQYTEPLLWIGGEPLKQQFIEAMQSLGAVIVAGGRFLHVCGQTDKGIAMNWLAKVYKDNGAQAVQTIALGDSDNDTAMLNAADVAIQIKSPVHGFPVITNPNQIIQSEHPGPQGWAQCLSQLLLNNMSQQSTPLNQQLVGSA